MPDILTNCSPPSESHSATLTVLARVIFTVLTLQDSDWLTQSKQAVLLVDVSYCSYVIVNVSRRKEQRDDVRRFI